MVNLFSNFLLSIFFASNFLVLCTSISTPFTIIIKNLTLLQFLLLLLLLLATCFIKPH